MFQDREDAAYKLAATMRGLKLCNPLVLAIPRGGVVTGAVLARELAAELDVVLSRKLRAPDQPELAIGAIAEDGRAYLNRRAIEDLGISDEYLDREKRHQMTKIGCRQQLFRRVRPAAPIAGRSVIVADDGIATGATMMAALQTVRGQQPMELIVAVPVAPLSQLAAFEDRCDQLFCLDSPEDFWAVGQFYEDFLPVDDQRVVSLLKLFATTPRSVPGRIRSTKPQL